MAMMEIKLNKDERLDDLEYEGLKIIQKPNLYCFSSDAVLLANLVKASRKDTIVDLGTGSGVIAILALAKTKANKAIGFEIQKEMASLAKRNVEINNLEDRIEEAKDLNIATETIYQPVNLVLSNSLGMGGTNSALVFRKL